MFKIFNILLTLLSISILGSENIEMFKLSKIEKTKISILESTFGQSRIRREGRFLEPISSYPPNYKILGTYQEDLQSSYKYSKYILSKEGYIKNCADEYSNEYCEHLKKISIVDTFDCVLSACEIENNTGKQFFIFDSNNDEDFSNDKILDFESQTLKIDGNTVNQRIVTSEISIQVFNGNSVVDTTFVYDFIKRKENGRETACLNPAYYSSGNINLAGNEYFISLINLTPDIEVNLCDFIWIDKNDNKILENDSDYFQQMIIPFTINEKSYKFIDVDPNGNELSILEQDPAKFPPIAVGLPAPDFQFAIHDSSIKTLKENTGNYKLLDFWSCVSEYCSKITMDINTHSKNKLSITIIPFVETSFSRLEEDQQNKIVKISSIVNGPDIKKMRDLFQIGSEPTYILISPDNKILFKEKKTFERIDKFLNETIK